MENNTKANKIPQIAYSLIVVGIIVLIINTGILDLETGLILKLAPFIVAAIGVFLLLGKRSGTIAAAVILGAGGLATYFQVPILGQNSTSSEFHQIQQALGDVKTANIKISPSIANLNINALTNNSFLLEGGATTHANEELITEFKINNRNSNHASYRISSKKKNHMNNYNGKSLNWNLNINPKIPLDLEVSAGVGNSNLNLFDFNISKLDIETGIGDSEISLPKTGDFKAKINTGVGTVTVKIPSSLAIRIKLSKAIGNLEIDGSFEKRDSYYYSSNYDTSSKRVNLEIDSGIGNITIKSF